MAYFTFSELQGAAKDLPTPWTLLESNDEGLRLALVENGVVKIETLFKKDFTLQVKLFQTEAPSCPIPLSSCPPKVRLGKFLVNLGNIQMCPGNREENLQEFAALNMLENKVYFKAVVVLNDRAYKTVRSSKCSLINNSSNICKECKYVKTLLLGKKHRKDNPKPLSKHHPLTNIGPLVKDAFKENRKKRTDLESEFFKKKLEDESEKVEVEKPVHDSLVQLMEKQKSQDALTELFWKEQQKAFSCKSIRWHPQMIRMAIYLKYVSTHAYRGIKDMGILRLPGETTLRDYTNIIDMNTFSSVLQIFQAFKM